MNCLRFPLIFVVILCINLQSPGQVWVNRVNGSGDYSDKFNASCLSQSGFLYLAGYTMNPGANKDLLLVKLNPATGDTIWTNFYNGPGSGADEALDMAIDGNGYIYTTGFQKGAGTGNDFITIKYDSTGLIVWTATYNYPSNEYDQSNSIAIDGSGNVFIAGQSDSDPGAVTNDDFVIIKYDANGNQLWANRYDGFGSAIDRPAKILLDASANVYVTGRSSNGFDDDYLTMKYNTSGILLWSQLFDRLHADRATDMKLNSTTGVLYVTGRSSNGSNYDYVTIKYNASGVQQWAKVYDNVDDDRATKLDLDGSGNIYVTGQSDADASGNFNYNIVTIKYNNAGIQQWTKAFNGPGNNDDEPNALFVSASGDLWITGQTDVDASPGIISLDIITLHYSNTGALIWSQLANGNSNGNDMGATLNGDAFGNIYVAGYSESNAPQRDAVVIKYDNSGGSTWQKLYNGTGDNSDNMHSIMVDQTDQVYLAGYVVGYGQDRNFATVKINPQGDTAWIRTLNGSSPGSSDDALGVTSDNLGNVYSCGYTKNSGTSSDFTTVKYLPNGDTSWVRYYNYDPINESDRAYSIALDGNQDVYVTGRSDSDPGIGNNDDMYTIKYSNSGNVLWSQRYNGNGNGPDAANSVRISSAGNVFVAGKSFNGIDNDFCVIKYNSSGQQQWIAVYNSTFGDDEPAEMVVDNNENIFLTGWSMNPNVLKHDVLTVKFNASGGTVWSKIYNGTGNGDDEGKGIALDNSGNIVVTGFSDIDTSLLILNNDYLTIKYDIGGNEVWVRTYDGYAGLNDAATGVVTDNADNIFVTGQSDNGSGGIQNYDFVTLKYTSNGVNAGSLVYNGTLNASDVANSLFIKNNDLYIAGSSYGTASQRDMVTLKYDVSAMGTLENNGTPTNEIFVMPNPLTSSSVVTLDSGEILKITFTDITGRIISIPYKAVNNKSVRIYNDKMTPGIYHVTIEAKNNQLYSARFLIK